MELNNNYLLDNKVDHLTENDVKFILEKYFGNKTQFVVESFSAYNASDKMLGFLADYWKLKIDLILNNNEKKVALFFIKAVSRSNAAKAAMVKELKLFDKETYFYTHIKNSINIQGLKPWSPILVAVIKDAVVFEDLNAKNYKVRNKFLGFDKNHSEQALQAIARFHASSIIFEESKSKDLQMQYRINDEFGQKLDTGGYVSTDPWFVQCMDGALEAVKIFSKYTHDSDVMKLVERKWKGIWTDALVCEQSSEVRKVICHRDLWNNNMLFHYNEYGIADDCLMVDYQAVMCQPPSSDVMLLLYCNLRPRYREQKLQYFLDFYYQALKTILGEHDVDLEVVIPKKVFLDSAEKQRKWGLIVCACLIPQFWVNDELTTKIFCDSTKFDEILSKNKGAFIKKMMMENNDYKENVITIFDEIIERYCLA